MSVDEITAHARKYSKSFNNGPWQTDFDEMAKKTVLKRALKYAPLKSDFVKAQVLDGSVKNKIGEDMTEIPNIIEVDQDTGEVIEENTNA